jgi:hypothetical protein
MHGRDRTAQNNTVGKPEGKRPLETHKHRWEGKTKLDIEITGCQGKKQI